MRWKVAGVLMCAISMLGCSNDVQQPEQRGRVTVKTEHGTVVLQNAVYNAEAEYVVAEVVGEAINYTFRMTSTGDGAAVTGGLAELLDEAGNLLISLETTVNNTTGEVVYTQATPQDYLTQTIVADDERVREHYDANGDVASFEYPALSDETQRHAVNYYEHGLPVATLPGNVSEYIGTLRAFDAYYAPHSTSTLHNNPDGEILARILTSPEIYALVVTVDDPEPRQWRWIEVTCSAARACQSLVCYTHPTSIVCFACTAVSVACSILDIITSWFGD